jgi:hypothetical protein
MSGGRPSDEWRPVQRSRSPVINGGDHESEQDRKRRGGGPGSVRRAGNGPACRAGRFRFGRYLDAADPAASPSARDLAVMAYDAATGTAVLFGGYGRGVLGDTWTWNGTTWAKQAPAAHPTARVDAAMAYDAATSTTVLFGGIGNSPGSWLGDTWTWG